MIIETLNVRTLRDEEKLLELENALEKTKVLGVSEVIRRENYK